ncbi:DUF262 domain-containing protein [Priestia megaterium]|uniref:DUF262 domain-containing protein n=1 Tax=Priestia megaterium TaxID=1404 RepID=UPI001785A567|nr:DUF262 domain-containing protein [Priestia megaterium]MBD8848404.1 DUF262 domain-containing protein [Priestia megaterium]
MKIHAYDKTITNIFNSEVKYIIPRFQREYSWTKDEVSEFWSDIIENIEEEQSGSYLNKEYFIGSLVLVEENEYKYQIVDGQQRMTTITIFFSAIIEQFKQYNKGGLAQGLYRYVEGSDLNAEKFFKLVNENPKPFFHKSIQNFDKEEINPDTKEEHRLQLAYDFFSNSLKDLRKGFNKEEDYIKYLIAIRDQLLGLKTIFISVNNIDEAYTIFETLNSKGISLTTTDLIKNDIFKVLNYEHPVDDARAKWKDIQNNTKSNRKDVSINTFIRHYWLSKYEFITQGRLYKAYKKLQINEPTKMKEFLDNLLEESNIYHQISFPNITDWKQQEEKRIFSSLEALNTFKVTQPKTLLLSLFAQRKKGIVTLTQLKNAIKLIENFHFIFTAIASERASGVESKYSTLARKIRNAKNKTEINEVIVELYNYLNSKAPSYDRFEKGFLQLKFTNNYTSDKKLIQYIFKRFEENLHTTDELTVGNISIEHIVPQSNKELSVGIIGNLLPIDKKLNEIADRKELKEKIEIFSQSKLLLVQNFILANQAKENWIQKDIIVRTKELASTAYYDVFKLDISNNSRNQLKV